MPTAPAVERPDMFIAACIAFFIMGFIKVRRLEPSESVPCNRPQTNEWRGFMQVAFLLYHFCNYFKAYIPIRAFVAAYVWQTGWGNTLYFCSGRKNPYTIKRFLSMIWRIDFFVVLLSMVTATSWIYYYVVALHTLHFCMVFCFGLCGGFTSKTLCAVRVSSERGDSSNRDLTLAQRWPVYVKLVIFLRSLPSSGKTMCTVILSTRLSTRYLVMILRKNLHIVQTWIASRAGRESLLDTSGQICCLFLDLDDLTLL